MSILGVYIFFVGLTVFIFWNQAFASQTEQSWNFADSANFIFDDDVIETSGSSVRLKAQNYTSDDNTVGLYHFDETIGSTAPDSSGNSNVGNLLGDTTFGAGILNNSLTMDGSGDYISVPDSASLTLSGQQTLESWVKFDNNFSTDATQDYGVIDKGSYKLYFDRTSGKLNYEIANNGATTWTKAAGGDVNGSWDFDGKTIVRSIKVDGSDVYVGLGLGTGDAEVWKMNGTTWTKIGGDGVNNSWADQVFEDVNSLVISGNHLYAGLGTNTAGDAEVWSCNISSNCSSWTKVGGDGINGGWAISTFESVYALESYGGNVYAGLGASANDAEVWKWNGSAWTKIGGDSLNSGWTTNYEAVYSMTNDGTNLYVGLGNTAADGEIWKWNGTSWAKVGGDGTGPGAEIEYISSLDYFDSKLYAGTASTAGDGDVWEYSGTTWTKIGGDGINSGWAASAYEIIASLSNDGTNLYAGLGNSNGDGEVWKWNGSAWTKIGGDGINSGYSTNQADGIYSMAYSGGKLYTGLYDAGGDGTLWSWDDSSWTIIGGSFVNKSWGYYNLQSVESSATLNGKLYVGTGINVAGNAMVWQYNGSSWQIVGGQGVNDSWPAFTYENVFTLQSYKGELYAGLGTTANDAEVWKWDGSTWSKVGGDSLNGSWAAGFESVNVMSVYDGNLYAGLGISANDAEVWKWDGSTWSKVGGDSLNSGWTTNFESVLSMTVYDGKLYAGLGSSTLDAEVWSYNGTTWSKVGGDGLNDSWNTIYEEVFVMRSYNGKLVVGLGSGTGDATVWQYDGANWSKIGGDDVSGSWTSGTYERIRSISIYNGELYVGTGDSTGDGELWKYDGNYWQKSGGTGINNSWTSAVEYVSTIIDYKGKLYVGTGYSGNADAALWTMGDNAFLASEKTNFNTSWHHIAATYSGSVMKIFIDGELDASLNVSVTAPGNNLPLLIGSTYGGGGRGESQGYFDGKIDEVRLSSTARNSFTTHPYKSEKQTVTLAHAAFKQDVESFASFSAIESLDGGSITYQLSDDDGESWKYWNGTAWEETSNTTDANNKTTINTNIPSFPVTFGGIKWRAIIQSNGDQRVGLDSVTISANDDLNAPTINADNILAKKSSTGSGLSSGAWTNGGSPYFSWDSGSDAESGIYGYCLYLGQDETANPVTTKGLLGLSPANTGGNCQFITSSTSIDLSQANLLSSPLVTSDSNYIFIVTAIDKAGNVASTPEIFQFKFDNTPPSNPGFISSPSGFINTKEATLTWPINGSQSASDGASGLAGLQYRINDSEWYGDAHDGTGSISDLLTNDGSYTTLPTPDFNNIIDGTNTIYFRSWDDAGNVSTSYVSAALKINTNGAPSQPQNINVSPKTSSTNNFSFSWSVPDSFVGSDSTLNYCYTINTEPSSTNCNFTGQGIKSLAAGPYATQPGVNTIYVVAKDESGNINYASYASTTFTANTASPGVPGNVDIVDVSIKVSSKWRLAVTWDVPVENSEAISSYKIYRSTNNINFSLAGTSSSTTFIDASLSQVTYYYYVKACDSTNNCSANSSKVSMLPTGKFTEPAGLIGEPVNSNLTTKRATVTWITDRESDSKIALGTASGQYGSAEIGNSDQVSIHTINLENLAAGTTYYYVVKWTDVDGNTGTSQEFTFKTAPAPVIKEVVTTKAGLNDAIISFTSVNANKINLYYGPSDSFGGLQSINTSTAESKYNISIAGLNDGTKYYYQVAAVDSEGTEYKGNIFSFVTPQKPRINSLVFQPVEGEPTSTQSITWTTNVPSTSTITYGIIGSHGTDVQNSELTTSHKIVISGLQDDSEYYLIAQSRDSNGNLAISDQQRFKTALDTRPPNIYDVTVESSIRGSGSEARGQVIISWKTDEPSTSQVAYTEGSNATVFNNKTSEDTQLSTEHIVVVSNLPTSKVYSIQPISYDKARNIGTGETQTEIIGRANESVLTIIINSLQKIFGL